MNEVRIPVVVHGLTPTLNSSLRVARLHTKETTSERTNERQKAVEHFPSFRLGVISRNYKPVEEIVKRPLRC